MASPAREAGPSAHPARIVRSLRPVSSLQPLPNLRPLPSITILPEVILQMTMHFMDRDSICNFISSCTLIKKAGNSKIAWKYVPIRPIPSWSSYELYLDLIRHYEANYCDNPTYVQLIRNRLLPLRKMIIPDNEIGFVDRLRTKAVQIDQSIAQISETERQLEIMKLDYQQPGMTTALKLEYITEISRLEDLIKIFKGDLKTTCQSVISSCAYRFIREEDMAWNGGYDFWGDNH